MSLWLWARLGDRPVQTSALIAGLSGVLLPVYSLLAVAMSESTPFVAISLSRVVIGLFLLPTALGLAWRRPWARLTGIVLFAGIALTNLLEFLVSSNITSTVGGYSCIVVPITGTMLSVAAMVILLFAREEFETDNLERAAVRQNYPGRQ